MSYLFTSESVTKGHPDKVADYISDSILDAVLTQDQNGRVAVETSVTGNTVFIYGETTSHAVIDPIAIAKEAITSIGYEYPKYRFNAQDAEFIIKLSPQSPDIALGVDEKDGKEQGAGDQGIMFGYAKDDTKNLMPLPIDLSHRLSLRLTAVRENGTISGLGPDGKTQVTVKYDENHQPVFVDTVVVSTQHDENKSLNILRQEIIEHVVKHVIPTNLLNENTKFLINPTGRFVLGGPEADSGLTGRKIIVDTYGGFARHGGGAFSGKDASKVDRSASYMARYLAKQIVGSGIAKACEIQLAYAIGVAKPVSVYVNTFGTSKVDNDLILETIDKNFDLRPKAIIEYLNLKHPQFKKTVNGGHFGREDQGFAWEKLDKIDIFAKLR